MHKYTFDYLQKYIHDFSEASGEAWGDIIEYIREREHDHPKDSVRMVTFLPPIDKVHTSGFRIKKYLKNEGYYRYHADAAWLDMTNNTDRYRTIPGKYTVDSRILSVIMYFNTVDEGGETVFPLIPISIKPVKGRIAVFPTHWTYLHKAEVPVSSDKYSMNTFIHAIC